MFWTNILVAALAAASATPPELASLQMNYPPKELKKGIEGVVGFEVKVAKDGRVTDCEITQSSGNAELDRQTCTQLRNTAQFKPATNSAGKAIKSTYASRLRWTLPHPMPETQSAQAQPNSQQTQ